MAISNACECRSCAMPLSRGYRYNPLSASGTSHSSLEPSLRPLRTFLCSLLPPCQMSCGHSWTSPLLVPPPHRQVPAHSIAAVSPAKRLGSSRMASRAPTWEYRYTCFRARQRWHLDARFGFWSWSWEAWMGTRVGERGGARICRPRTGLGL